MNVRWLAAVVWWFAEVMWEVAEGIWQVAEEIWQAFGVAGWSRGVLIRASSAVAGRRMPSTAPVIAVIGDVVQSRAIPPRQREKAQQALEGFMAHVNKRYSAAVASRFLVTLGDEFQGLLEAPDAVPDIVQDMRERLPQLRIRLAVSRGTLTTSRKKTALGMDGPAWHAARDLIEKARARRDAGEIGVWFAGFRDDDVVLNALSGLLGHHWEKLVATQREVVTALRHHEGLRKDAAKALGISQQSLSNRAQSAGAREYAARPLLVVVELPLRTGRVAALMLGAAVVLYLVRGGTQVVRAILSRADSLPLQQKQVDEVELNRGRLIGDIERLLLSGMLGATRRWGSRSRRRG